MTPIDDTTESAWGPILVRWSSNAPPCCDDELDAMVTRLGQLGVRARTPLLRTVVVALAQDLRQRCAELARDDTGLSVASGRLLRALQARPLDGAPRRDDPHGIARRGEAGI